ncbi:P-loop containing nucleoside triphosphate hydrolase protein [Penicillium verhagenii]|nr:P-loop containing nucleoside triphosphate hydrolase protein [Penicillium verhagenii]
MTTIHQAPERPETPPPPLSNVPFRRDPDFIDRVSLLEQIQEKGSTQGARIALVGLGGVGKSQLAIEYCHRVRVQSPDTWVFWIYASNATRFEQSCREIADRAKIPGRQDLKANIFKLLHDWLHNTKTGNWVLVLDNLDDDRFLHTIPSIQSSLEHDHSHVPERSIWSYLCQNSKGCVVITSRSRGVALKTVEDYDIIPVEPMDEGYAISLFEKKLGAQASRSAIIQLVAALEFIPLAIVQAAAFIKQRAPRETVTQYLERFQKSDRQKIGLLDYEGGQLRRDPEAANSILLTWQISFEDIQGRRPSAADLLSLMSFFDIQGIPEILLREGQDAEETDEQSDESDTEDEKSILSELDVFEDDILLLRNYSLMTVTSGQANFVMHRLVQLAMQKWLDAQGCLEHWKEISIQRLDRHFPEGSFENWKECQLLFPHVQYTMIQQPVGKHSIEVWASLLHKAASFALTKGNLVDSKKMAKKAMEKRDDLFGMKNEKTLRSSNILGMGEWKKAEELQLQVMEMSKQVLGPEHPDTLSSIANLASTYWSQGLWKEAEELGVQVIETREQVLGPEHPDTLTSIANLASTYQNQGRWKEAEDLGVQVMKISKQVLGPEHPDTLSRINNLALLYWDQGRWKEAEELEVQVMETRKQVLGPEHPDTLISISNLALTYWKQGRWKEAEELGVQVMETSKRVLGPEHPATLTSINNLASTYQGQGRWKEAEELGVQVMETSKRVLRPEHPSTLNSIGNLALTYWKQGRWKEAEELGVLVMETRKRVLGPEHPSTLTSINNLASIYRSQGRWKQAEELQAEELKLCSKVLGPEHPDTLTSLGNLAFTLRSLGDNQAALQMMAKCAESRSKILGPEHPSTLSSMSTWTEWQGSGETLPVKPVEPQIVTSLEEPTEPTT